jgi:hypothetical protein
MDSSEAMSGTGYLLMRVSTAQGAIPVEGATVTVRDGNADLEGKGSVIRVLVTDRDGKTERIALAAPPRENSERPAVAPPYATYHADVEARGYYRQRFNGIPVYDTITSIQPVFLIPIAQNGSTDGISEEENNFDGGMNPALRPRGGQG